jgi:hypothetical protein
MRPVRDATFMVLWRGEVSFSHTSTLHFYMHRLKLNWVTSHYYLSEINIDFDKHYSQSFC